MKMIPGTKPPPTISTFDRVYDWRTRESRRPTTAAATTEAKEEAPAQHLLVMSVPAAHASRVDRQTFPATEPGNAPRSTASGKAVNPAHSIRESALTNWI